MIVSGGRSKGHRLSSALVDLNAGTGEVYLKKEGETILGSAGHALKLKLEGSDSASLRIVLVEESKDCFSRLRDVIRMRWPQVPLDEAEGSIDTNTTGIYLLNQDLLKALDTIDLIDRKFELGRTIFLFDPLRTVPWNAIRTVARRRIKTFYQLRTEFIVFLFTSDLFLGRDGFAPLPRSLLESNWNSIERESVHETDMLLGGTNWRKSLLNQNPVQTRMKRLVEIYRIFLHSWFRYILPLPFAPKDEQLYHLFVCSNYETGIERIRNLFAGLTHNLQYAPSLSTAYSDFTQKHPEKTSGFTGNRRPIEFRILWAVLRHHEEGICDIGCIDLVDLEPSGEKRMFALNWLRDKGYLERKYYTHEWPGTRPPVYSVNWAMVRKMGIEPPPELKPLLPDDLPLKERLG